MSKVKLMRLTLSASILLMLIKFLAYYLTRSNAVLTDALESIINVMAGAFALYSLTYASRPKDSDHPYGHGKMEYLSAGFEGGLILIAGLAMILKASLNFFTPAELTQLDMGIYLSIATGSINYIMGAYLVKRGKREHSALMQADGKHLISDTVSTIGLVTGLAIIYFTQLYWLDNALTILFGFFIIYTGFKIVRESVSSLLDEADMEKLNHLAEVLNKKRSEKWIDIHNLRVLKFGPLLHVDAHITLPWFFSLEEAHAEVSNVEKMLNENTEGEVEFFIHADPCIETSCSVCSIKDCVQRKQQFKQRLDWTLENMLPNEKHRI